MTRGSEAYKLERDITVRRRRRRREETTLQENRGKATHTKQMAQATVVALSVLALLILYVSQHAQMARYNYQLLQEKKKLQELKIENDHLELQIMKLSALDRVEGLARGKGRMIEPGRIQFLALSQPTTKHSRKDERVETINLNIHRLAKPAHTSVD